MNTPDPRVLTTTSEREALIVAATIRANAASPPCELNEGEVDTKFINAFVRAYRAINLGLREIQSLEQQAQARAAAHRNG